MRTCPDCKEDTVIEDGYCARCRQCTLRPEPARQDGAELGAAHGWAAQPWIAQPTRAGWWWWTGHEEPLQVQEMTNGQGDKLGLGVVLSKVWIKLCANMDGRWAGPCDRPALPDEETQPIEKLTDKSQRGGASDAK